MSLLGKEINPEMPAREAINRRKQIREDITGVQKHPVERKERQKPHPQQPRDADDLIKP